MTNRYSSHMPQSAATKSQRRSIYFLTAIMTFALSLRKVSSFNNILAVGFGTSRSFSPFANTKLGTQISYSSFNHVMSFMKTKSKASQQHPAGSIFFSSKNNEYESSALMMQAGDDDKGHDATAIMQNNEKSTWNVPGLKKETSRLTLRCHKKIGKAATRLSKANEQVEEIRTNPDATLEELEACPNIQLLEEDLNQLRNRLKSLNLLEEKLLSVKGGKSSALPDDVLSLVLDLDVKDEAPKREQRPKKKKKGPRTMAPRLPYFRYYTQNETEIRVGRRSQDNDELSCNPQHRDGADWWMHASGCPGSHVVIRCHDNNLDNEVKMDAAVLAARQSKCNGNIIKVSLTRCRDVKKPPGAKFGLVQLVGKVETVSVNMKQAEKRLERLDKTILMNGDN